MSTTNSIAYTVVETADHLREVAGKLSGMGKIQLAVDCEGKQMSREGTLELVQIGVQCGAEPLGIYIIDVRLVGDASGWEGMRKLLEDDKVEKLMWDCRADSDVLAHFLEIRIKGVVDLQLADALRNPATLRPCIPQSTVKQYTCVRGLRKTLEYHSKRHPALSELAALKSAVSIGGVDWDNRPLPPPLLAYAAVDVSCLFILSEIFVKPTLKPRLLEASRTYSSVLSNIVNLDVAKANLFSSYILQAGILSPHPKRGPTKRCQGCLRMHPADAFPKKRHCAECHGLCCTCGELLHRSKRDAEKKK